MNKHANGRLYRSNSQPQVDNVDVWGTLDDSQPSDAKHAVFITNFNVSCDATQFPARSLDLILHTSTVCNPSQATVYSIDDTNGAISLVTPFKQCTPAFCLAFFVHASAGPNPRSAWTGMGSPMYIKPLELLEPQSFTVCIRYPNSAEISQMILASELQLRQVPLVPVSPGMFQLQLQLQPQSVTVLAFSCDGAGV